MGIESVNPATGELLQRYDEMKPGEIQAILARAEAAQRDWAATDLPARARVLRAAASRLRARREELAALMAREMGKPLAAGDGEVEKCAWVCEFYAEKARAFLSPEPVETDASKSYVSFEPLGVVLAVMPWNFPLWQVFRFAAPALMAGNGGLLKHASNVSGCALAIESVLREAELPEDVFRTLLVPGQGVAPLIEHPAVVAVTLTGSTPAGRAVAGKAGSCLKKSVLELGGSDPFVVLEDADLEAAVESGVTSRLINTGQSCIAAKRFILPASRREQCEALFVEKMRARRTGDPFEEGVELGPLARRDLRDELHEQVRRSVSRGPAVCSGARRRKAGAPSIRPRS